VKFPNKLGRFAAPFWVGDQIFFVGELENETNKLSLVAANIRKPTREDFKSLTNKQLKEEFNAIGIKGPFEREEVISTLISHLRYSYILSEMVPIYTTTTDYISFLVSPDSSKVALSPSGTENMLIIVDRTLSQQNNYRPPKINDVLGFFWSPNSRYLLYLVLDRTASIRSAVKWGIYDSTINDCYLLHSFRITNTFGNTYLPFFPQYGLSTRLFSPDSEYFVYCDAISSSVYVSSVKKGSIPIRITDGTFATWSPV